MSEWILVVLALNSVFNNPGTSSYEVKAPAVSMQEFGDKAACMFARDAVIRRAKDHASNLDVFCVPKKTERKDRP